MPQLKPCWSPECIAVPAPHRCNSHHHLGPPAPTTSRPLAVPSQPFPDADYVASVADFSHLYSDEPTALMLLCEFILNTNAGTRGLGWCDTA